MVQKTALALILLGTTAQAQTTSECTMRAYGHVECTTQDDTTPYVQQDWGAVFQKIHDRHVQKKIANLINTGNCQAAFNYALAEGFEWAQRVKEVCQVPSQSR